MKKEWMEITQHKALCHNIFELTLKGTMVAEMHQTGQFLHIQVPRSDLLLRRPISLSSINQDDQTCKVIYRADGEGTRALSECAVGDKLNVLGPLGQGFPIDNRVAQETVYLIGGGIGVPPLYELAKQLHLKQTRVVIFNGFANEATVFYEKEFSEFGEVIIATDDGSYGETGSILDAVSNYTKTCPPHAVYACGPTGMLRVIEEMFEETSEVYLSLEERMACGIGACYACVCPSKQNPKQNRKVCDEGPVFKKGEVII